MMEGLGKVCSVVVHSFQLDMYGPIMWRTVEHIQIHFDMHEKQ